jgi:hypothetical protein
LEYLHFVLGILFCGSTNTDVAEGTCEVCVTILTRTFVMVRIMYVLYNERYIAMKFT